MTTTITSHHRHVIRALVRVYHDSGRLECGLDTLAARAHRAADWVRERCIELQRLGVVTLDHAGLCRLSPDMIWHAERA